MDTNKIVCKTKQPMLHVTFFSFKFTEIVPYKSIIYQT